MISFKLDLSPQNFRYDVLYPLYSGFFQKNNGFENLLLLKKTEGFPQIRFSLAMTVFSQIPAVPLSTAIFTSWAADKKLIFDVKLASQILPLKDSILYELF